MASLRCRCGAPLQKVARGASNMYGIAPSSVFSTRLGFFTRRLSLYSALHRGGWTQVWLVKSGAVSLHLMPSW